MANPEHLEILKQGVAAWNEWRKHGPVRPDLSAVQLSNADLRGVQFINADLRGALLGSINFFLADLRGADLSRASLMRIDFKRANLDGADFTETELCDCSFGNNDLSQVKGLQTIQHYDASVIGISTIYRSRGNIPETFLRGCGVPEDFITYARSLINKPIEFYSCFISYSSKDQEFADRLHADLQAEGVRVWFAPHDMKIGARIRPAIDDSIRVYDKLLLVLSEHSVGSHWVEQEVETALAKEEEVGREVLFPVRLDEAVMVIRAGWPALVRRTRHVGDFTDWKEHDSYREAFDRLLRDLRAGA